MKKLKTRTNPFKPGSGLFPPYFAGRNDEIDTFEQKLTSTLSGASMHLAVIGGWGIGKTSLLTQIEQISKEENCLIVSSIAYPEDMQSFVTTLMRRVDSEIKTEVWLKKPEEFEFALSFLKIKFASSGEAQHSLQEFLFKVWSKVKQKRSSIIITIDDLDLIENFKGTMLLIRNTAMELNKRGCKIMFIISGAPVLFEKMYKAHAPLIRFFEPVVLNRLDSQNSIDAIKIPLERIKMSYDIKTIKKIAHLSDGHPYYLQEIANHVFQEASKDFDEWAFKKGFIRAFSDLSRDIFERTFEGASRNEKRVLLILARNHPLGFKAITAKSKLPQGSVATALNRLKQKEMLLHYRKQYSIEDKLFAEFIKERLGER